MLEPGHMNQLTHACPTCGATGPFYPNRAARTGQDTYCIPCRRAISADAYQRQRRERLRRGLLKWRTR